MNIKCVLVRTLFGVLSLQQSREFEKQRKKINENVTLSLQDVCEVSLRIILHRVRDNFTNDI